MDLSNTSFIITTTEGEKVINPQSDLSYKDIKFFGNGYYEWGKVLNQNFAAIMDKVSILSDGGVQQATFDANQFISTFQNSQTAALDAHTNNLLNMIDIKLAQELAEIDSGFTSDLSGIQTEITDIKANYVIADTALQTDLLNHFNTKITDLKTETDVVIVNNNNNFETFKNSINLWKTGIDPKVTNFTTTFDLFKDSTNTELDTIKTSITDKYTELNNIVQTLSSNTETNAAYITNLAKVYTDGEIDKIELILNPLVATVNSYIGTNDLDILSLSDDITEINNNFVNYVPIVNNILTDAKSYTDLEIGKLTGTTGTLTNLNKTVTDYIASNDLTVGTHTTNITTLTTNLSTLNTDFITYKTSNDTALGTLSTLVGTNQTGLNTRLNTIETTYKDTWESYTNTQLALLNTQITTNAENIESNTEDIATINETLLTITGSTTASDLGALTTRVVTLETQITDYTTVDSKDAAILSSAKSYADDLKTTIEGNYASADTATLNSAKSYTDSEIGKLDFATPDEIDSLILSNNETSAALELLQTQTIPNMDIRIDTIDTKVNGFDNDIQRKLQTVNSTIVSQNEYNKSNYVTYDTIFPIMKKVIGYVIENRITKTESDDLFTNIIAMFKDEAREQYSGMYYFGIKLDQTNNKIQVQLYFDKNTYKTLTNVIFTSGTVNTFTSFNTGGVFSNTQKSIINNLITLPNTYNLNTGEILATYKNEFGFDNTLQLGASNIFASMYDSIYFLKLINSSTTTDLVLELGSLYSNSLTITSVLLDDTEIFGTSEVTIGSEKTITGNTLVLKQKIITITVIENFIASDLDDDYYLESGNPQIVTITGQLNGSDYTQSITIVDYIHYAVAS